MVWMLYHNGIKINHYLSKLMLRNPYCEDLTCMEETIIHVMQYYKIAKQTWNGLLHSNKIDLFFTVTFVDWMEGNLSNIVPSYLAVV